MQHKPLAKILMAPLTSVLFRVLYHMYHLEHKGSLLDTHCPVQGHHIHVSCAESQQIEICQPLCTLWSASSRAHILESWQPVQAWLRKQGNFPKESGGWYARPTNRGASPCHTRDRQLKAAGHIHVMSNTAYSSILNWLHISLRAQNFNLIKECHDNRVTTYRLLRT